MLIGAVETGCQGSQIFQKHFVFHFSGPNRYFPLLASSGVSFKTVPADAKNLMKCFTGGISFIQPYPNGPSAFLQVCSMIIYTISPL